MMISKNISTSVTANTSVTCGTDGTECNHKWIYMNGIKVCKYCYEEYDDSMDMDDTVFSDTHVFMSLVNGGGLMMSGGYNKYNLSSHGKAIQHMCNLNNHNYMSRLMYVNTIKVEEIVNKYSLPIDMIQATMNFFKTIIDVKNLQSSSKRYNIMQILSSCFFYASKKLNLNINHKQVASMFCLPEKHVTKGIKIFNNYMQSQNFVSMTKDVSLENLYNILTNWLNKLQIDDDHYCNYNKMILKKIYDNNIFFKYYQDRTIASVIYYTSIIMNKNIILDELCKVSNISTQSILKSYSILQGYNRFLIE